MSFLGRIARLVGSHGAEATAVGRTGVSGSVLGDLVQTIPSLRFGASSETADQAVLGSDTTAEVDGDEVAIALELPLQPATMLRATDAAAPAQLPMTANCDALPAAEYVPSHHPAVQPQMRQNFTPVAVPEGAERATTMSPAASAESARESAPLELASTTTPVAANPLERRIEGRLQRVMSQPATMPRVPTELPVNGMDTAGTAVPPAERTTVPVPAMSVAAAKHQAFTAATVGDMIAREAPQLRNSAETNTPRQPWAGQPAIARAAVPTRAAPPPPAVHIGNLEIIVEASLAPAPAATRVSPGSGSSFVSSHYLRSW
jgi:hypothetical protein